jgi:hypothetical protein
MFYGLPILFTTHGINAPSGIADPYHLMATCNNGDPPMGGSVICTRPGGPWFLGFAGQPRLRRKYEPRMNLASEMASSAPKQPKPLPPPEPNPVALAVALGKQLEAAILTPPEQAGPNIKLLIARVEEIGGLSRGHLSKIIESILELESQWHAAALSKYTYRSCTYGT